MPRDPLEVFGGVLENIWLRLVGFVASIIVGVLLGSILAEFGLLDFLGSVSVYAALVTTLAMLVTVVRAESARSVCLALAINCAAWCVMMAIVAAAVSQA